MSIISATTVQSILGIGDTYATQIGFLIPYVQDDILNYVNNYFKDPNIAISVSTIAFVDSDPDTITDSGSGFVTALFADGMDIIVENSVYNDGVYEIDTVAAGILTLVSTDELIAELVTASAGVTITRVKWPKGLQMICAQLIWENIDRGLNKSVESETVGDYRVHYTSITGGGYSEAIMSGLEKYTRPGFA